MSFSIADSPNSGYAECAIRPLPMISKRRAPLDPSASLFSVGSPLIRNFDPRGDLESGVRSDAIAFFADDEKQGRVSDSRCQKSLDGVDHGGDDALGIAGATPPNVIVVFARGEEGRYGIDVR